MKLTAPVAVAVHAGDSPLSEKIALKIKPDEISPLALCSSYRNRGSFTKFRMADACIMIACQFRQADAWATAFCNMVKSSAMVQNVTEQALMKPGVSSVVIISGESVGLGGSIEITFI